MCSEQGVPCNCSLSGCSSVRSCDPHCWLATHLGALDGKAGKDILRTDLKASLGPPRAVPIFHNLILLDQTGRCVMSDKAEGPLPESADTGARPTHRLESVKVGDVGVQLLVSTKDHLYNAKNIEAGRESWQVIGSWEEGSVQELGKILSQREGRLSREPASSTRFGTAYGNGQTLGTTDAGRRRQIIVRQE